MKTKLTPTGILFIQREGRIIKAQRDRDTKRPDRDVETIDEITKLQNYEISIEDFSAAILRFLAA